MLCGTTPQILNTKKIFFQSQINSRRDFIIYKPIQEQYFQAFFRKKNSLLRWSLIALSVLEGKCRNTMMSKCPFQKSKYGEVLKPPVFAITEWSLVWRNHTSFPFMFGENLKHISFCAAGVKVWVILRKYLFFS